MTCLVHCCNALGRLRHRARARAACRSLPGVLLRGVMALSLPLSTRSLHTWLHRPRVPSGDLPARPMGNQRPLHQLPGRLHDAWPWRHLGHRLLRCVAARPLTLTPAKGGSVCMLSGHGMQALVCVYMSAMSCGAAAAQLRNLFARACEASRRNVCRHSQPLAQCASLARRPAGVRSQAPAHRMIPGRACLPAAA